MKAKRITLLVSIICVVLVFVVLSSTVFSLNRVEFCFLQSPIYYKSDSNIAESVIKSGKFNYGESVFLIDKEAHAKKIEKEYPYIKVVGIETKFPNVLLIQSIERQAFFAVPNEENTMFAICDGDFKVLRVVTYTDYVANPEYPSIDCADIRFSEQTVGDFLIETEESKILAELPSIFEQIDYKSTEVGTIVKKFDVQKDTLRILSYNNYRIEISEPTKFLTEKIALAYTAIFGDEGVSEDFCGLISVYQKDSKLYANSIVNG